MHSCMFTAILALASTISVAFASFVTYFPPSASQCSNFTINFTGNQISFPISFLLLPVNSSSPVVVELPDAAFDSVSNSGTYTTPIPFSAGTQFIAVTRDTLGVGNGGVSPVYTVGESSNAGCIPQRGPNNTLAFRLEPSPPSQCEIQTISWAPLGPNSGGDNLSNVNVAGYVPGGTAFKLNVKSGESTTGNSTLWQTTVPQGQAFMFLYERRDPVTGTVRRETSAIQNVQPSSQSDCTRGGPSVTPAAVPPSTSNTATQTVLTSDAPQNDKGSSNLPNFALIGIIVGGVCLILVLVPLLYLFYTRKYRKRKLSPLEDDQQTTMSDGSGAALIKMNPNAPMGISLPPVRASGFGIDSFSPNWPTAPRNALPTALPTTPPTTPPASPPTAPPIALPTALPTILPAATPPAQGGSSPSPEPEAPRQRGLFGRMKGRQGDKVNSVASWGNKGPLTQSIFEVRPEPQSVPVDAMSDISEYSMAGSVPAPLPPAAIAMSRGGSGLGRQRMQFEEYYTRGDSRGSGAQSSSGESGDGRIPSAARERPPARTYDSRASVDSPTDPSHDPSFVSSTAGQAPYQNYYPLSPSRANPLVQRRLSAYEGEDDYYEDGSGGTRTGAGLSRPTPAGQFGIAL